MILNGCTQIDQNPLPAVDIQTRIKSHLQNLIYRTYIEKLGERRPGGPERNEFRRYIISQTGLLLHDSDGNNEGCSSGWGKEHCIRSGELRVVPRIQFWRADSKNLKRWGSRIQGRMMRYKTYRRELVEMLTSRLGALVSRVRRISLEWQQQVGGTLA